MHFKVATVRSGELEINKDLTKKADCIVANNATWKDLQEILQEETNIKTTIRNADQIEGAAGNEGE